MADNVAITAGSGTIIAADDIAGVLHQRVKLSQGADGSATDVSSAAPLNVTLANTGANAIAVKVDGSAVVQPVSGTVTTTLGANSGVDIGDVTINNAVGAAAVNIQDGGNSITVDGTIAVSTINSVAPAFGSGIRGATVQRVTIATDDVVPISDNAGSITVDNGGTFAVQAAQSGTWTVQPGNTANTTAWKVDGSAVTQPVSMSTNTPLGTVAHNSADSGAPIKVGGRASSAEITAVTTGNRVDFITDLAAKQIVMPYANNENFVSGAITTAMTATTSTSLIAAPAAGLRNYITTIIVSNSHATVGTDVIIQDGNAGTTLLTIPAAAVYGGAVINLPVPLRQPTTATAIYCANVTTGASTKVSAVGYKGY